MTVHTQIFIVIYSKSPNVELKCPSTGKCISKLQYIHAMKYYSAIKKEKPTTDIYNNTDKSQMHFTE